VARSRALSAAGSAVAIAATIVTIALSGSPWVVVACVIAGSAFGYAGFRGLDLLSGRVLLMCALTTVVGTLAVRGASDFLPSTGYSGDYIVVGGYIVQPGAAPMDNSVGPSDLSFGEGDTVTIDCKTPGIKNPKQTWYRIKGRGAFIKRTNLVPSYADPPDTPPDC
jgi:hypothetical protein